MCCRPLAPLEWNSLRLSSLTWGLARKLWLRGRFWTGCLLLCLAGLARKSRWSAAGAKTGVWFQPLHFFRHCPALSSFLWKQDFHQLKGGIPHFTLSWQEDIHLQSLVLLNVIYSASGCKLLNFMLRLGLLTLILKYWSKFCCFCILCIQ